jgi:hypothetical protein
LRVFDCQKLSGLRCGFKTNTQDLTQLHSKSTLTRDFLNPVASLVGNAFSKTVGT